MVSPEHKRRAVTTVLSEGLCSMRRACRYLGLGRSSYYYEGKERKDYEQRLIERIKEISEKEPTYGYRFVTSQLQREGWRVNRKKVQRLRRREGLQGQQTKRKERRRGQSSVLKLPKAEKANDVWSWDFIFDTTEKGKSIKILSVVDEASRFNVALEVGPQMSSEKVVEVLEAACERYGRPKCLRSDNGPEFISKTIQTWVKERGVNTRYIEPGSPWQNGYVESFHSRFRNDCLNREWFINELDAKVTIAEWRETYNHKRPHSGIDYLSPAEVYFNQVPGCVRAKPSLHREPQPKPKTTIPIETCQTNI
jgi:putative transposase